MILDEHTACPMCPQVNRDAFVIMQRAAPLLPEGPMREELSYALESQRVWYEAHHANQLHAFSAELESARNPRLDVKEPA